MPILPVTPTTTAAPGTASAHTLQAFIELVYVKTANDVLVQHLGSLENALSTTQKGMDILTQLQNLKNQVKPVGKSTFNYNMDPFRLSGFIPVPGGTVAGYQSAANDFFGKPVKVAPNYGAGGSAAFLASMASLRAQIVNSLIPQLSAITPRTAGQEDSNSLLAKMRVVLNDIDTTNATTSAGAVAWLTDQYNISENAAVTSAGILQQHITNAITAGESLNTTQTESVRNFLQIYEEYYKSASAVLTAISQIIQKMADGIAR